MFEMEKNYIVTVKKYGVMCFSMSSIYPTLQTIMYRSLLASIMFMQILLQDSQKFLKILKLSSGGKYAYYWDFTE
jgi:hypothetical protein